MFFIICKNETRETIFVLFFYKKHQVDSEQVLVFPIF